MSAIAARHTDQPAPRILARLVDSTMLSAALAALVVLPVALAIVDALPAGVTQDDALYIVLAKSLATGQGYRWLNLPGAPNATHYPPGYPALLALLWHVLPAFPASVVAFKMVNAILLAIAAASVAVFARCRLGLSAPAACLTAIAGCVAIPVLVMSNLVMSEIFFLALLVPALLMADRRLGRVEVDVRDALLLGIVAGGLLLVRSLGIAFAGAVALTLLRKRAWKPTAVFLVTVAVISLPWQWWQHANAAAVPAPLSGAYGSYGGWLLQGATGHAIAFAVETIRATSREVFDMFWVFASSGLPSAPLRYVVTLFALGALVVGIVALIRRAAVAGWFLAGYLSIVICWPFTPARFVWGIWPLVVLAAVMGALELRALAASLRMPRMVRGAQAVLAVGCALTLVGHAVYNVRGYRGQWWSSIARSAVDVAGPSIVWIARNTPPTALVATNNAPMVYLYTGRPAVPATSFTATEYRHPLTVASLATSLHAILDSYRVDVVLLIANDSLEAAGRRLAAAQSPQPTTLVLRNSVPYGLIFTPQRR